MNSEIRSKIRPASSAVRPKSGGFGCLRQVKGIPYEGKLLEASKGELKTPEFLAINPLGRVPALRDGNFTLAVIRASQQLR
jgi:hypothetical protein